MKLPKFDTTLTNRLVIAYFALAIGLPGLVYVAVQQEQRQSANDPQIQMAEDAAAALDQGLAPASAGGPAVDMRASLAPFLIVTDADKKVISATGNLDGKIVIPPLSAFDEAKNGENRVTWQPAPGVREAAVIVAHKGGYVLAARSLREVEVRESYTQAVAAAAFLTLFVVGVILFVILK